MDVFLWGLLKVHFYSDPSRTVEDLAARRQAAVATADAISRRVGKNAVWRTAVCLEMDGGRFENIL
jgi:hypothetical protein